MRPHRIPRDAPLCRCTPMCRWCSSWAPAKPSRRRAPQAGRYTNLIEARTPPRVAAQRTSDGPFAATSVTPRSVRHGNLQHSQVLASRYGHQQHRIFHHPQLLRRGAWWGWPGPLTNEQSNKVEVVEQEDQLEFNVAECVIDDGRNGRPSLHCVDVVGHRRVRFRKPRS